jgi:hypothetical protein
MSTQIISQTKNRITIALKSGKEKSFSLKSQSQLRDCVNYLESEDDYIPLILAYGDDSLKASYRLNDAGKQRATESRRFMRYIESSAGKREVNALNDAMIKAPGFMPKLGDTAMGYR